MTKHFSPRRKSSKNSFSRKRFDRPKRVRKGPYKYFVFWKPYDVLSQFKPAKGSNAETLASYINVAGIYPTGRLDRDSEGLLLLSDDGQFQHKLCEPKFEHWRTYLVQVERAPTEEALQALRSGVMIKRQLTSPARVERLNLVPQLPDRIPPIRERKSVDTAWLRLSLTEGRNRQVRRMTAAVGHPTLRLIRSEIHLDKDATINLKGLVPGELRPFTELEYQAAMRLKQKRPKAEVKRRQ